MQDFHPKKKRLQLAKIFSLLRSSSSTGQRDGVDEKKARVMKSRPEPNLPAELWSEILCRLPVKSLVRFRCVSKSWRSLIDDPNFGRLHLNRFKNNSDETHLFVMHDWDPPRVRCSNTFKAVKLRLSQETGCVGERWHRWHPFCSIDGLVMLKNEDVDMHRPDLSLWNPSIRKSRILPRWQPDDSCSLHKYADLGLGYDPLTKDYKHVRLAFNVRGRLCGIGIYTISYGSWRAIKFRGIRKEKGRSRLHWCWNDVSRRRVVCFKGCLYAVATNWFSCTAELLSFDLSTESFDIASLPAAPDPDSSFKYPYAALLLVDDGCSLAVFNYHGDQASIWVLASESSEACWTKRYTFPLWIVELFYLKKNGNALVVSRRGKRQVMSYNIQTQQAKVLLKRHCSVFTIRAWPYIESLIQP